MSITVAGNSGKRQRPQAQIAEPSDVGPSAIRLPLAHGFVHGVSLVSAENLIRLVEQSYQAFVDAAQPFVLRRAHAWPQRRQTRLQRRQPRLQ